MTTLELIDLFQSRIIEIYKEECLKCLRGFEEDDYFYNGKNILLLHSEATKNLKQEFNQFENIENLLFISDEIMYFTSQLYFYRPYLNNPLENPIHSKGTVYYPYNMGLPDKRYFMFSEIVFEKVYAFWSQITQLLAASLIKCIFRSC